MSDPIDCSKPGFHVLHYLPEFAQIHVHWVSDAIYLTLCHPILLLPSIFPSIWKWLRKKWNSFKLLKWNNSHTIWFGPNSGKLISSYYWAIVILLPIWQHLPRGEDRTMTANILAIHTQKTGLPGCVKVYPKNARRV